MQQHTPHVDDFAAFVGLDCADAKHDMCLQTADTDRREFHVLQHKPEASTNGAEPPSDPGRIFFGAWVTLEDEKGEEAI